MKFLKEENWNLSYLKTNTLGPDEYKLPKKTIEKLENKTAH